MLALVLAGPWAVPRASAHEMTMAEMELRETQPGDFFWQWTASNDRPVVRGLEPRWPASCRAEGNRLHCGDAGLRGRCRWTASANATRRRWSRWPGSTARRGVYTVTAGQPTVRLYGAADDGRGIGEIARPTRCSASSTS